jgi:hypothetical protein
MKIGDVVCLSEYGIARDYNRTITNEDPYQVGVIVKEFSGAYPYRIHWVKATNGRRYGMFLVDSHSRRELKYAGR